MTFQVLRRTQVSLGHKEGMDPKVAADQFYLVYLENPVRLAIPASQPASPVCGRPERVQAW